MDHAHAGIFLYYDQGLPDRDPEGLVRAVTAIYEQYGLEELDDQLITLDEWYSMTKRP